MWVLGTIVGAVIVVSLIFGWYSLDDFSPLKRVFILVGIVAGVVVLVLLVCLLGKYLGTIGLYLLCTIAFLGPAFKGK